jgi:hypothetical protein
LEVPWPWAPIADESASAAAIAAHEVKPCWRFEMGIIDACVCKNSTTSAINGDDWYRIKTKAAGNAKSGKARRRQTADERPFRLAAGAKASHCRALRTRNNSITIRVNERILFFSLRRLNHSVEFHFKH